MFCLGAELGQRKQNAPEAESFGVKVMGGAVGYANVQ
jgi:hypothetical protein